MYLAVVMAGTILAGLCGLLIKRPRVPPTLSGAVLRLQQLYVELRAGRDVLDEMIVLCEQAGAKTNASVTSTSWERSVLEIGALVNVVLPELNRDDDDEEVGDRLDDVLSECVAMRGAEEPPHGFGRD